MEFTQLSAMVEDCRRTLDVQFKRMAQIQAELDEIKRTRPQKRAARARS